MCLLRGGCGLHLPTCQGQPTHRPALQFIMGYSYKFVALACNSEVTT